MKERSEGQVYIFLDTMVFLHCVPIEQMDLLKLLGANSVTLVIPRITIQELDKHKNTHQYRKIRDRARDRLRTIECCMDSPSKELKPGVLLELLTARPARDLGQRGLNIDWPDGELIASVLSYKEEHPSDRVVLISYDVGPKLTAKQLGVETAELPESCKIPPEEDPLVSENRRLKKELLQLQNVRPRLILRLSEMQDDDKRIVFKLSPPASTEIPDKCSILAKLREAYPELHPPKLKGPPRTFAESIAFESRWGNIPKNEYERYNRERNEYFSEYEQYIDRLVGYRSQPSRILGLYLEVRNIGGAPAEDVDVLVIFPDGFSLYTKDDYPGEPKEPKPPRMPQTEAQRVLSGSIRSIDLLSQFQMPSLAERPFSLRRTRSYELREHFDRIKHHYLARIRPIFLIFDSFDKAKSFKFDYDLTAGNVPEPVNGSLNVIIQKDNCASR